MSTPPPTRTLGPGGTERITPVSLPTPMPDWAAALIGVAVTIVVISIAIGIIINKSNIGPATLSFVDAFVQLFQYAPHVFLLFGPIADVIGQQFKFTIPTISAILAGILNTIIGKILVSRGSAISTPPSPECLIPGLEWWDSAFLPQAPFITQSIIAYFLIDSLSKIGGHTAGLLSIYALITIAQAYVMKTCECFSMYVFGQSTMGAIGTYILAMVLAWGVGAITYGAVWAINPGLLPLSYPAPPGAPSGISGSIVLPTTGGNSTDQATEQSSGVGSCSAPNDQDQFVCEAYKNGQLVTQTIAE